jgi:hypothetical protein
MRRPRKADTPPPDTTEGEDPAPTPVISADTAEQLHRRIAILELQLVALAEACLQLARNTYRINDVLNKHANSPVISSDYPMALKAHGDRIKEIINAITQDANPW